MFKRILNTILGNANEPNSSMKTPSIEEVRAVVYDLMAQHQTTTTLDVKNELRRLGFQAFQDQVSQMVNAIVSHDQLAARNNGKYNIYSYGKDTNESKLVYLESEEEFWEGSLSGKTITFCTGKIGTDGKQEAYECYKNVLAVRDLERMVAEKTQAGYQPATDSRPPLEIRLKYGHLFEKKAISCSIGYFNVIKKEYKGTELITKSAGYTFTWDLSASHSSANTALSSPTWSSMDVRFDSAQLLGEKVLQRQSTTDSASEVQLEADNRHIFQVEVVFENGEKAVLNKFQLDLQRALLPLVKQLLNCMAKVES